MTTCIYCDRRLIKPTVKYQNKNYHLDCYMKKDGSKILPKPLLDDPILRLEFMGEICDNALGNKSSLEERQTNYKKIRTKYADLADETINRA